LNEGAAAIEALTRRESANGFRQTAF